MSTIHSIELYIFIVMIMMDQACENSYFLDGAHAQPADYHMAWADVDFVSVELVVLVGKNRKEYISSALTFRMIWLPSSHQRALHKKRVYLHLLIRWGAEIKINCKLQCYKNVIWILSLACAAETFKLGLLDVILKTFVLKSVINICSFIATVN